MTEYDPFERLPVIPLGHSGTKTFYYFVRGTRQVVHHSPSSHTQSNFLGMASEVEWQTHYSPGINRSTDWDVIGESLMAHCRDVGLYDPSLVRGTGAWIDDKDVVFHAGDALYVNGHLTEFDDYQDSNYLYLAATRTMHPVEQENITQDCKDLLSVFKTWGWDQPSLAPSLLLGWVGCALICGAIQWRPHLWITGTKGCGKSTLDKLMSRILGDLVLPVQGSTTEAGLRQALNGNARPVLFDEFEADNNNAGAIIDAARSAASDNAAPVIKGTPEGRANIYKLKFAAMFSGIIANLQKEADRSRFVILEMHTLSRDEEQRKHLIDNLNRFDAEFGSGLLWRMLDALDSKHFEDSLATFKTAIRLTGGDERKADVYAHLLATSHVLTSDDIITDDEAKSQAALIAQLDEGEPSDEDVCLSHLLGYRITVEYGDQRTIGEWLLYTREDKRTGPIIEAVRAELARQGVLIDGNSIKVANATSGIKTVYSKSRWAGGGHSRILRRIPKLVAGGSARFAGEQSRYTVIPWNVMFSDHE